jgi:hypothetical protein
MTNTADDAADEEVIAGSKGDKASAGGDPS